MSRHTIAARKARKARKASPAAIVRKAIKGVKAMMDLLSSAKHIKTVVYVDKCISALVTEIRKHENKVSNALKKECYSLEGRCGDLYDQTHKWVFLAALDRCIENVSKLTTTLASVSDRYSSPTCDAIIARFYAIIARFYAIYRMTKNVEQADELENQFTRACAYFEMERERKMDEVELDWCEGWEKRHKEWEEEQEKWEEEKKQEEEQEEARVKLLLEYNCSASNAKDMSSLEAVKTQFYELYPKCNYLSVFCMNIRDMFMRTCQNAAIRLKCPTS
jgi:hypothetical protein